MNAHQRAMVKTAMTVGIIAIIIAVATVWPPILGYAALIGIASFFLFLIYGMFRMYENDKDFWNKRR